MPPKLSSIRNIAGTPKMPSAKDPKHAQGVKGKTTGGPKGLKRPGQG